MAASRDWDKDLASIDRKLGSMSDADLLASTQAQRAAERDMSAAPVGASPSAPMRMAKTPGKWGVYFRVGLSLTLGVGLLFWPYDTRCGWGLIGFLAAAFMTTVTGVWGGIFSWKVRMPAMHVLSIILAAWGLALGGLEVLPRVGYAVANDAHPSMWLCR